MTELPNAGHELEARRWARILGGRRSLSFAVGAEGLEAVVERARALAPEAQIDVLRIVPADGWGPVQRALAGLPVRGALVLDLARHADGSPWSARDWLGLNLARDAPERADRHLLLWVRGFDGLEALRDGAPDLWMHRSQLLMFPSAADFAVAGERGPGVREELERLVGEEGTPDLSRVIPALAEVAWDEHGAPRWLRCFARFVATTWLLGSVQANWVEVLAEQSGGRPLRTAVLARLKAAGEPWASGEPSSTQDLEGLRHLWQRSGDARLAPYAAVQCSRGLATDRPRVAVDWLAAHGAHPLGSSAFGRRVAAHAKTRLAHACLAQLDGIGTLENANTAAVALQALELLGYIDSPASVAARAFALYGLTAEAGRVLSSLESQATSPWNALLCHAEVDVHATGLRTTVVERSLAPNDARTTARERFNAARLLRILGTPADREIALGLLAFADDPPISLPFLCSVDELRALDPHSPDPIEAALAILRDASDPEVYEPAPLGLDELTFDPVADLRVDAFQLRAALLRELGRPSEALVAIRAALARPDIRSVREIAAAELEYAQVHAALGDTAEALAALDRCEVVVEGERDATIDVRPLTTLVGAAVVRARLLGDPAPIHAAIALCEADENRALVFELHLELAALEPAGVDARRAAARAALLLARETGFVVLEARASAWCARLGGDDAPALRERAEWVAARCPDRRLARAMAGERALDP